MSTGFGNDSAGDPAKPNLVRTAGQTSSRHASNLAVSRSTAGLQGLAPARTTRVASTRRALLVEDDPAFQAFIEQALASLRDGWRVRSCGTAAEALGLLRNPGADLDLVLVDIGLPDLSGIAVVQAARRRFPAVPILVASVFGDEATVLAAIRSGAQGYVLKDGVAAAMARDIQQVLQGHCPITPALARHLFKLAGTAPAPGSEQVPLSPKERELLRLIARGLTYEQAALSMGVALSTVQTHIRRTYLKLQVDSKTKAISTATQHGWL